MTSANAAWRPSAPRLRHAHLDELGYSPLPETIVRGARRLIAARNLDQARQLLQGYLQRVDVAVATTDRWLIEAARIYTEIQLVSGGPPGSQIRYAHFAYASAIRAGTVRTQLVTGALLGRVAHTQRLYRIAIVVRSQLWGLLTATAHGDEAVTMRLSLAESLHAAGRCGEALRHAELTWSAWRQDPDRCRWAGRHIAVAYARILVACALQDAALALLAQAGTTDAALAVVLEPLIAPTSELVAGIIRAHDRVCARHQRPLDDLCPSSVQPPLVAVQRHWHRPDPRARRWMR